MDTLKDIKKRYILARLEHFKGNRTHTAKSLGIGIRTLQRNLKEFGIGPATNCSKVKVVSTGVVYLTRKKAAQDLYPEYDISTGYEKLNEMIEEGLVIELGIG